MKTDFVNTLTGVTFYDRASSRKMKYIYPDCPHETAGWILFLHASGAEWVPLRKASEEDIAHINKAVIQAHHK